MEKIFQEVVDYVKDFTEVEPESIGMESGLREDLGVDSMGLIMMVDHVERKYQITLTDEQMISLRTIGDVVRFLDQVCS